MWIAGLRGAMAYALALDTSKQSKAGKMMLLITLLYALFTILGISSLLNPVMEKCEVRSTKVKTNEGSSLEDETNYLTRSLSHEDLIRNIQKNRRSKNCCNKLKIKISYFDMCYISPNFIKNIENDFVLLDPHGLDQSIIKKR